MYVSHERRSSVQAMQLSNGLANPAGLWLGHLIFDTIVGTIISLVVIIVFVAVSGQFHGPGLLVCSFAFVLDGNADTCCSQWLVLFLYGIAGALFAYCATIITVSPLAAFALVAGYQFVIFLVSYMISASMLLPSSLLFG